MKLKSTLIAVLVTVGLMASGLAGCQQAKTPEQGVQTSKTSQTTSNVGNTEKKTIQEQMAEDAKNPVKMTITLPHDLQMPDNAPILAEFTKRTGITFKFNCIPGDAHQKLGMMLASDSLTDVMMVYPDQLLNQYRQSDKLVDLKPLLQKDAPTVYSLLTSDLNMNMLNYFTEPDGRVLHLTRGAVFARSADETINTPDNKNLGYRWLPWKGSLYVQYPSIDEIFGKKITSLDEWHQAMVAYKAKYPNNYATTMCNEYGEWMLVSMAQMYGYKVETIAGADFITKDGKTYQSVVRFPEAVESLKFLNKLYKEGLMDKEGPIQNMDAFVEKMSAGRVFSFLGNYDKIGDINNSLAANDSTKDRMYVPQCVKAPGVTQRYEANFAYTGDNCMLITKKCADPDRFARFLEYLFTDEGLTLNGWGIKDQDYIVNADGKLGFSQEQKDRIVKDENYRYNRGFDIFEDVISLPYLLHNGQLAIGWPGYEDPASMTAVSSLTGPEKAVAESKYNYFKDFSDNYWSDPTTLSIVLEDNSKEALTSAKISTPMNDLVIKAIVADTDAQIEQLYKDAITQFELDGLSDLEKTVQATIDSRRK